MYGFLNTQIKRKAFKRALNKAFDFGYDPVTVANPNAKPAELGKIETPIEIQKNVKPFVPKTGKSLRKPESGLIDLSKHKNWRTKELKNNKSFNYSSKSDATLFDELFPEAEINPVHGIRLDSKKTKTNAMLDDIYPEIREKKFEDEFIVPIEEDEIKEGTKSEADEAAAWQDLFTKIKIDEDEGEGDAPEMVIDDEPKTIMTEPAVKVKPEPVKKVKFSVETKEEPKAPTKSKLSMATKNSAAKSGTKKSSNVIKTQTSAKSKKRKNKIKFDADIIGGW